MKEKLITHKRLDMKYVTLGKLCTTEEGMYTSCYNWKYVNCKDCLDIGIGLFSAKVNKYRELLKIMKKRRRLE